MAYKVDSFPGREIIVNGKPHLYFGGTSYLGLQTDAEFQDLFVRNIRRYGTNYSASRKSNVQISVYEEAESYLAEVVGSEACTTLSSGYLVGQFIAQSLHTKAHRFFYSPNTHSALYKTKIRPYTTFTALNIAVREHLTFKKNNVIPVVFLDAIDFSGCNYPHFDALQILPLKDVILVVDDSHGIGIVGQDGGGVYEILSRLKPKELLVCCSLGKGFGIQAGAIFGSKKRIAELTETSFFGGASPAVPAAMATLLEAKNIYREKRVLLKSYIDYFVYNLKNSGNFHFMKAHPAFTFSNVQLTEYLAVHKIIVSSFPYPDENAHLMSRIVLSAAHKKEDIERLLHYLNILP